MHRITDIPSNLKRTTQEVIEVRIWETYLTRSRTNLYQFLAQLSLDNGPVPKYGVDLERMTFRFLTTDWERSIKVRLAEQSVPAEELGRYKMETNKPVTKKRIYVAEDDLDILFALNTILEEAGYDVVMFHCGNPMLQSNLQASDLFILDKLMPDIDGLEVCRHLKSQPSTKHIPVIMISAIRNAASQAKNAGVDDFLEKPFKMNDFLKLVSKHTNSDSRAVTCL